MSNLIRDPYQEYVYNCVIGSNPLQLVVTMYETAIRRIQEAICCLESDDAFGRARAISKAGNILAELKTALNPEVDGDIGRNLDLLYGYMQRRLLEAHVKKTAKALREVENLLAKLLEAWRQAAELEQARAA